MTDATPYNFGGLEKQLANYDYAKIAVLPVAFDKTSTWGKGADKGPGAIIKASRNMELYDIETDFEVYKEGIFTEKEIKPTSSNLMVKKLYKKTGTLLNDHKFIVTLGGEHSISIGVIQAYISLFKNLSILHLDAHADMRNSYEGSKHNHACVMARVKELTNNIISVGIRSMDSTEIKNIDKNKTFYARKINDSIPPHAWIEKVLNKLSKNTYITIDLDVFDPAIMPSTGTPEPGGLDWYQVTNLLRKVSKSTNIVGFDVVELCPSSNKAPDFLAAKLIYKFLSYKFA